ncbi:MAG: ADP-dependent glucokinase/phosphofructokinase [Candidatus Heimdallarchaeaceae archaeon]
MENWINTYSMMLNSKPYTIEKRKGVLIGFNVNIDKIIEINPMIISEVISSEVFDQFDLTKNPPSYIENIFGFFLCLFNSIKHGKADEVLTNSQELSKWIENTFEIKETKIGGQAGIIANLYSKLGLKQVLLSLPVLDNNLVSLLNSNILTLSKNDTGYSIDKISKKDNSLEAPLVHYIFEFTAGTYVIGNQKIECNRANRFILSHDEINTKLKFNEGFLDYCDEFLSEYFLAIISGFHLINRETNPSLSFYDVMKPVEIMLKKWKTTNPNLYLHLEIASTKSIELRKTIIETLFPLVDSIGLNEQELMSYIEVVNSKITHKLGEPMGSVLVFRALNEILNKYPNLRIHFHFLGYFLILSKPIEQKEAKIRKQGLLMSSLLAAIKAEGKEITSLDEIQNVSLDISSKGLEELKQLQKHLETTYSTKGSLQQNGIIHSPSFSLIGVPTIIVKDPKAIVGLGDLISSFSILYEIR